MGFVYCDSVHTVYYTDMKIDVYNHVFPKKYLSYIEKILPSRLIKRWSDITSIHDMDVRMRVLDNFDDYKQIIAISPPAFEVINSKFSHQLAQVANTELHSICTNPVYSERMPWFIASLPMNNIKESLAEIDRVVNMGAVGFQLYTNVNNKALDHLDFKPIFEKINEYNKPIWIHPVRPPSHPDYLSEESSKYDIFWGLGWPYETAACISRLVLSGLLDEFPNIKVIAHHWGGMLPFFEGRIKAWEERINKPILEQLKTRIYGDTAVFGSVSSSQTAFDFWGAERSLFATDMPFGLDGGLHNIKSTIDIIDNLQCTDKERDAIYHKNIGALI